MYLAAGALQRRQQQQEGSQYAQDKVGLGAWHLLVKVVVVVV